MRYIVIALALFLFAVKSQAQELNCKVQINHDQIQGTQDQLYRDMREDIYEFMNNRKWTDDVFKNNERIDCKLHINLTKRQGSEKFIGTLQVQLRRPVYNAAYHTPLLNYKEKKNNFRFNYVPQKNLSFNLNSHQSNLTSVLAFYAYIIIGMDYDSFSSLGGNPYFENARKIVSNAQSSDYPGWKAFGDQQNRYWLVKNLLDENFSPLRECIYMYHRKGLDLMYDRVRKGRSNIANGLEKLEEVYQHKPNSFLMKLFLDAKSKEIVNIFSESDPTEAKRVVNVMKKVDAANSSDYEKILK